MTNQAQGVLPDLQWVGECVCDTVGDLCLMVIFAYRHLAMLNKNNNKNVFCKYTWNNRNAPKCYIHTCWELWDPGVFDHINTYLHPDKVRSWGPNKSAWTSLDLPFFPSWIFQLFIHHPLLSLQHPFHKSPTAGVFLPPPWCVSCSSLIAAHNAPWNRQAHRHTVSCPTAFSSSKAALVVC